MECKSPRRMRIRNGSNFLRRWCMEAGFWAPRLLRQSGALVKWDEICNPILTSACRVPVMPRGPENREDHSLIEMRLHTINQKLDAFIQDIKAETVAEFISVRTSAENSNNLKRANQKTRWPYPLCTSQCLPWPRSMSASDWPGCSRNPH